MASNRVRELRQRQAMSQMALAASVALTRQSLSAIESGKSTPSVALALKLAEALGATVEELFAAEPEPRRVRATVGRGTAGTRAVVGRVGSDWVAHPILREQLSTSAGGVFQAERGKRAELELLVDEQEASDAVLIMGCAPALGVLADRLNRSRGAGRFHWIGRSSTTALEELRAARVHIAGIHLVDARTGHFNVPDVRRRCAQLDLTVITLALWETGLLVRKDDSLGIRTAEDLLRKKVRVVRREEGSGAERMIARELKKLGAERRHEELVAQSHLEVAAVISSGAADVGPGVRDAAVASGLDFVPLSEERFDLVLARETLRDPRIERLLACLSSRPLHAELAQMGYDTRETADHVADLQAAN
jgi:molybdate-binding protein/DNA-binding XRE family transcriptional regulator